MRFNFTVGDAERHQMEFSLDPLLGDLRILLDGNPVVRDFRMFALEPVKRYELAVGKGRRHKVSILVDYGGEEGVQSPAKLMITAIR